MSSVGYRIGTRFVTFRIFWRSSVNIIWATRVAVRCCGNLSPCQCLVRAIQLRCRCEIVRVGKPQPVPGGTAGKLYTTPLGGIFRRTRRLGDRVDHFLDRLRVQSDASVKRDDNPSCSSLINSMAAL